MDRKEFLSALGFSAGALIIGSCMGSCKKESSGGTAPTVDFTIDLNDSNYSMLKNNGGTTHVNGVVVARTTNGDLIAVSQSCTHEGQTVNFNSSNNGFSCPAHGAQFSSTGAVTRGPASSALKQYTVTIDGTTVRIKG